MEEFDRTPLIFLLVASIAILALHITYQFVPIENLLIEIVFIKLAETGLFSSFFKPQLYSIAMAFLYGIGVKGMKSESIKIHHSILLILTGLLIYSCSFLSLSIPGTTGIGMYILFLSIGYIFFVTGILYFRRIISDHFFQDQFNVKNRLFKQQRKKISNEYSVNIKTEDGWINIINPFRATMVLGTPGSGKSYAIVEEFIHQHIMKGFSMLVYDFKYPDLSKVAYNYYLKYQGNYKVKPTFFIVDFNDCKNSHRVNPIHSDIIKTQADALAASEALFLNMNREYLRKKDFFNSSGVNIVACIIWYLRKVEGGKYCTLPHLLTFLNLPDDVIINILKEKIELSFLIAPFADALSKKAFDQLSGQTGTARIFLSRMASKEMFWILSKNEFSLKINDPNNPVILLLANNPKTQLAYGAIYGWIASTLVKVVNQKGSTPLSLIIDELPTMYIHGLDNLIATARSNKISTLLSFQDLKQLERDYGHDVANSIFNTVGNKIAGSVMAETAKKISDTIGKSVQKRNNISYSKRGTNIGQSTTMDYLVPPEVIAQLSQGEFCGVISDSFDQIEKQKRFFSKVIADKKGLGKKDIPALSNLEEEVFEKIMEDNFKQIKLDIDQLVALETIKK